MVHRDVARHGDSAGGADGGSLHHRTLSAAADWLRPRLAHAPDALRIAVAAEETGHSGQAAADALADTAVDRLRRLLARGDHSRAIASELLAVDALVTWACEAAAEEWRDSARTDRSDIETWCAELAARVAALPDG